MVEPEMTVVTVAGTGLAVAVEQPLQMPVHCELGPQAPLHDDQGPHPPAQDPVCDVQADPKPPGPPDPGPPGPPNPNGPPPKPDGAGPYSLVKLLQTLPMDVGELPYSDVIDDHTEPPGVGQPDAVDEVVSVVIDGAANADVKSAAATMDDFILTVMVFGRLLERWATRRCKN